MLLTASILQAQDGSRHRPAPPRSPHRPQHGPPRGAGDPPRPPRGRPPRSRPPSRPRHLAASSRRAQRQESDDGGRACTGRRQRVKLVGPFRAVAITNAMVRYQRLDDAQGNARTEKRAVHTSLLVLRTLCRPPARHEKQGACARLLDRREMIAEGACPCILFSMCSNDHRRSNEPKMRHLRSERRGDGDESPPERHGATHLHRRNALHLRQETGPSLGKLGRPSESTDSDDRPSLPTRTTVRVWSRQTRQTRLLSESGPLSAGYQAWDSVPRPLQRPAAVSLPNRLHSVGSLGGHGGDSETRAGGWEGGRGRKREAPARQRPGGRADG